MDPDRKGGLLGADLQRTQKLLVLTRQLEPHRRQFLGWGRSTPPGIEADGGFDDEEDIVSVFANALNGGVDLGGADEGVVDGRLEFLLVVLQLSVLHLSSTLPVANIQPNSSKAAALRHAGLELSP